jgi:predicted kinase
MGTGKSHIAGLLAPRICAEIFSSDRLRKEMAGIPLDERAREGYNEGIYSPAFSNAVYLELLNRAGAALAEGRSVIVDASFQRESDRTLFQRLAEISGALFAIVETQCDEETIRQRLKERSRHRTAISDGRWEIFPLQKREFDPPTDEALLLTLDTATSDDLLLAELSHFFGAHHGTKAHFGPSYKASA